MSHQKDTDYLSLSARIHTMETKLLTQERMERMIEAGDLEQAVLVLAECGYGLMQESTPQALENLLAQSRAETFHDLYQAAPDKRVVEVFQLKYDYHNAKVLLKAQAAGRAGERLLVSGGRYEPQILADAFLREEYNECAPRFRQALTQGKELLAVTSDPQRVDFMLDRAYFDEMTQLARETGSEFLQGYVRLLVDSANLRTALRSARLEKEGEFLLQALIPGGTVDPKTIANARGAELADLFQSGALAPAAQLAKELLEGGSLTEFERACDDVVRDYLAAAQRVSFGVEPLVGYLYAREAELTAVRTILSGYMAGLSGQAIRGRLRTAYAS